MTLPVITPEDLDALAALAADLDFSDAERRAVLLEMDSRDVNAAPGSGKTTVLAAKLLLLARKWPHQRRGICVLSHTNVARDEIQRRLAASADGARLLTHPHFIGTIHAFVNQFLALPYLRSEGIDVDVIDNDAFAKRAVGMAKTMGPLRFWMTKDSSVEAMVAGLVLQGADLTLGSEYGTLPGTTAKTYPLFQQIKYELTSKGIFRHADMFAFAEQLLQKSPGLSDRLAERFPLVFIDEMQDTSWQQEALLQSIFGTGATMQRYGDVNQRILGNEDGAEHLTFPRGDALPISTSKRFGPAIADVVAGLQLTGTSVTGERANVHSPLLIVYATERIGDVIPAFGRHVLQRFNDAALQSGHVKALCTRKQGEANVKPGRHLADYWPAYAGYGTTSGSRSDHFWELLAHAASTGRALVTLAESMLEVKRALLLVLRAAGAPCIAGVRDASHLIRRLAQDRHEIAPIRRLCRDLVLGKDNFSLDAVRKGVPGRLFGPLEKLLPLDMNLAQFSILPVFTAPANTPANAALPQSHCAVAHEGRHLTIPIGTVASMKGETHLATLVLESHGGQSKRFDLQEALPIVVGVTKLPKKPSKLLAGQFRSLYVGMSRPTSFLCVAANAERVTEECMKQLLANGWQIDNLG